MNFIGGYSALVSKGMTTADQNLIRSIPQALAQTERDVYKRQILTMPGYEADDILGTVAKRSQKEGIEVSVVSGDRDLLQLADEHIKIRIPKTSRGGTEVHDYYPEDVKREYQVTPAEFIDVKALMGDSSDNIPGVPSIGEKTATAIISAYGSIENAYAHLELSLIHIWSGWEASAGWAST